MHFSVNFDLAHKLMAYMYVFAADGENSTAYFVSTNPDMFIPSPKPPAPSDPSMRSVKNDTKIKKEDKKIERHTAEKLHADKLAVGQLESLHLLSLLFVFHVARFAIPKLPPA